MAVFKCTIRGQDGPPKIIRAKTGAAARAGLVEVKALNAEDLADLIADGGKIEEVSEPAGD